MCYNKDYMTDSSSMIRWKYIMDVRLFIAINFNEEIKDKLSDIMQRLKKVALKGKFTHRENLHLTVVFIGEVAPEKISSVKAAMDKLDVESFMLSINDLGSFKRDGGDIYWIGVGKNNTLSSINDQLFTELVKAGFRIEKREYKPHLTLGRQVVVDDNFDRNRFSKSIPAMKMEVKKISLMKSERINGKLTYTEIFSKTLERY